MENTNHAPPQKPSKTCPRCGETFLIEGGFYKSGATKDGCTTYCRECIKIEMRARRDALSPEKRHEKDRLDYKRRQRSPEKRALLAEQQRAWQKAHPEKCRERQAKYKARMRGEAPEQLRVGNQISNNRARAKKLGVPNNFHMTDWLATLSEFNHSCAFCGADQTLLDLEHLDALGSGGGNVAGNVVPACRPCNANKWRKTLEAFCVERHLDASAIRVRAQRVVDRATPAGSIAA